MKPSIDPKLSEYGILIDDPGFDPFADMMSLGDGYMLGKWHTMDLGKTLHQLTLSRDIVKLVKDKSATAGIYGDSQEVIDEHYDLGNDFFHAIIGDSLMYTCADWRWGAKILEQAQYHKIQRINEKIELEDGMRVLDLGCGWGGYARHTKLNYDVEVVGVTLSKEQAAWAQLWCDKVIIGDYSEAKGKFDRVISIGLLEHVGAANYRRYMKTVNRCLIPGGISYFQTIGYNSRNHSANPWVNARIFPNGDLPSFGQLADAMDGLFVLEDVENLGIQYAYTAQAWYDNFMEYAHTDEGMARLSAAFVRKWQFYFMFFKAAFLAREFQLWQVVMSKQRLQQAVRV